MNVINSQTTGSGCHWVLKITDNLPISPKSYSRKIQMKYRLGRDILQPSRKAIHCFKIRSDHNHKRGFLSFDELREILFKFKVWQISWNYQWKIPEIVDLPPLQISHRYKLSIIDTGGSPADWSWWQPCWVKSEILTEADKPTLRQDLGSQRSGAVWPSGEEARWDFSQMWRPSGARRQPRFPWKRHF